MLDVPGHRSFRNLLRRYRLEAGLTHEELAARAHLSAGAISALERGKRLQPRPATVRLLATALGLDPTQTAYLRNASRLPYGPAPTETAAARTNLPIALTSFVGRGRELSEVRQLLGESRLVTLTGAGGCGKTRLALQVASALLASLPDGIWLVELASLADPHLVPTAVASALQVRERTEGDVLPYLVETLRSRHFLLILDNCEHLIAACAQLAGTLLRSCARVRILATSREPLGIAGELTWRVPSLSLVDPCRLDHIADPIAAACEAEAVQLFLDRARLSMPTFDLTRENAPAVAQICERLDGIPLAIELAAARLRALSATLLASRLDDRFRVLSEGNRADLPRQQTLQATVDWSYELLRPLEQLVFRRLAVFAGGFSPEALEGICADSELAATEVIPILVRLVDQSLVEPEPGEDPARYRLLETVRAYAWERLGEAGEVAALQRRHVRWYLGWAEEGKSGQWGIDQKEWMARFDAEHENLRSTLRWCLESDAASGLRLACCLDRFWVDRGYLAEGQRWLEDFLAHPSTDASLEGAARWRLGTLRLIAGDVAGAKTALEESVAKLRASDQSPDLIDALVWSGVAARSSGEDARATALLEESFDRARGIGYARVMALALGHLGQIAYRQGDLERARARYAESLALFRTTDAGRGVAWMLWALARVARSEGNGRRAWTLARESLGLAWEIWNGGGISGGLTSLGICAQQARDHQRAVRLIAAAARESLPAHLDEREERDASLAASRAALGEADFSRAWAEGQAMTLEEAVACALEGDGDEG